MWLIIGLGNPGPEYDGTRHNVGFDVLAALAKQYALSPDAPVGIPTPNRRDLSKGEGSPFTNKRLLHAETLECEIAGQRVLLAKPMAYMNESGKAVAALTKKYPLSLSKGNELLVVHDDLDLLVGTLRLSAGGSSGGHKGVQSIIDALHSMYSLSGAERSRRAEDFLRLRIGIGPNATPDGHRIPAEKFVLETFRREERASIDAAIARAVEVITVLLRDGLAAAQQVAN